MKLSELMDYAVAAYDAWGDLECFIDADDEECFPLIELVCEIRDSEHEPRRIMLTNYEMPEPHLRLVK